MRFLRVLFLVVIVSCITDKIVRAVGAHGVVGNSVTITLKWDGVVAPDLSGYNVYSKLNDDSYVVRKSVESQSTTCAINLVDDGTYVFYVTAVDLAGNESKPSNTVTYTVDTAAPPAPTNLTFFERVVSALKKFLLRIIS